MFKKRQVSQENNFVEMPTGIFTSSGIWFHTNEESLREFAGEIVDRVGFSKLLDQAVIWTNSPDAVAALVFIATIGSLGPAVAVLLGLTAYYVWYTFLPALVAPAATPIIQILSSAAFQGLVYIVILSMLGNAGEPVSAFVGLGWFLSLRWGLLSKIVVAVSDVLGQPSLPKPDGVLRSVIVRHAVGEKVTIKSTESFENRIREIWQREKQK